MDSGDGWGQPCQVEGAGADGSLPCWGGGKQELAFR